ncbi:MAG: biopolymer transporter ExbD [Candidatus Edwardsbacteria bacterium]
MPKKVKHRVGIRLDMTPMVDIAFLLVIFFMCTYHARPPETVHVDIPESRSPFKVPESDVMIITVLNPEKAVALAESINPSLLRSMVAQEYEEIKRLNPTARLGLAIDKIIKEVWEDKNNPRTQTIINQAVSEWQTMDTLQKKVRIDSLLLWWNLGRDAAQPMTMLDIPQIIREQRTYNPRLKLVVKVDRQCQSGTMLDLMKILQDPKVNMLRFSLVTTLKYEKNLIPE